MSRVLYRTFVVFLSMVLAYSSAWAGVNSLILNLSGFAGGLVQSLQGIPKLRGPGAKPIFRGANPRRDPKGRGGRWKLTERQKLANVAWKMGRPGHSEPPLELMFASMLPSAFLLQDVGGGEAGGQRLEGEGGYTPASGAFGDLNTNTGNLMKSYGIVGWNDIGQADIGLSLVHNSMSNGIESEFGKKWSFTYGMKVVETSGTAYVKWDDGTIVPYDLNGSGHGEREGFFSSIQKSGTAPNVVWTLTAKDQTRYILNNAGLLTAIKDRNNNQVTVNRNSSGQITTVHGPTSTRTLTFTYNSNGYVSQVQDYSGRVWEFTYNTGNLTQIKYPRPTGTGSYPIRYFGYDNWTDSRITEETDLRSKLWLFNYDTHGQLANVTDPESNMTIFWYTTTSTTIELPGGEEIVHNYSDGLLASEVDAEGHSVSYSNYNTNKQARTINDKRGNNWTYEFGAGGNITLVHAPGIHAGFDWEYAYNSTNDLISATDPLGNTTTYNYDTSTPCKGRLLTVVDPLSHTVLTNTYDSYGQLLTSKDALNRTTTYTYTSYGEADTVEAPNGAVTDFTYDTLGRVNEIWDEDNNNWQFDYDYWNRRVETLHPDASSVQVAYDWENNVTSVTDENGHTTSATYDDAGRKISVTNAKSETESYIYNSNSWVTSITNGRGKTRTYEYTDRGELYRLTMPDGTKEVYTYDYNGNLAMYTVPKTVGNLLQIEYEYDNSNRLITIDYDNQTDTTFEYDEADRRTQMVDSTGTTTWGYDDASRQTSYAVGSNTTTFGYNNAGQKISMVEPGSLTTTYNYSSTTGQLTSIVNPYSETTSFTYDALGRLDKKTLANGTREEYAYDARSRVTDIVLKGGSGYGTTVRSQNYTYDDASNVLTHTTGGVTTTYGYDDIDQLVSESRSGYSASYSYDGNGNRLTRTVNSTTEDYAYDDADKLQTVKIGTTTIKSFTYDEAGRTTRQTTSAGNTDYTFDEESRITGITGPGISASYSYNGLDTRISKTENSATTNYRRMGAGVTAPVLSDGTNSFTPGISSRAGSNSTWDYAGIKSNDSQVNSSGSVAATRTYDAFGNVSTSSGTWKGPFTYGGDYGYQSDEASGLKLLGHRYYDSSLGRFLTRDPIKDGRNWYGYCENNPIRYEDSTGLIFRPAIGNEEPGLYYHDPYIESGGAGPLAGLLAESEGKVHSGPEDCGQWVRSIYDRLGVPMPTGPANTWADWFAVSGQWVVVPNDGKHIKPGDVIVITRKGKPHGHIMIVGADGRIYNASLNDYPPRDSGRNPGKPISGGKGGEVTIWRHRPKPSLILPGYGIPVRI